jgi:hypothetical protein
MMKSSESVAVPASGIRLQLATTEAEANRTELTAKGVYCVQDAKLWVNYVTRRDGESNWTYGRGK